MKRPFPWGWFIFWMLVCMPIAFLVILCHSEARSGLFAFLGWVIFIVFIVFILLAIGGFFR